MQLNVKTRKDKHNASPFIQPIEAQVEIGYQQWFNAPERKASVEVDCGTWWNLDGDAQAQPTDARWRVSWIVDTSELYAVELRGARPDRYLLLGYFNDEASMEAALAGWENPESVIYHNLSALAARLTALDG